MKKPNHLNFLADEHDFDLITGCKYILKLISFDIEFNKCYQYGLCVQHVYNFFYFITNLYKFYIINTVFRNHFLKTIEFK